MDASTTARCREIAARSAATRPWRQLTGSRTFERFTGPQIRKFARTDPAAYARPSGSTSSARSSLAARRPACAARSRRWLGHEPDGHRQPRNGRRRARRRRRRNLPPGCPRSSLATVVGTLSPDWQRAIWPAAGARSSPGRATIPAAWLASAWSAQGAWPCRSGPATPCSASCREATSTRRASVTCSVRRRATSWALTCFQNGSLARERVRDAYGLDWQGFSAALAGRPPGNRGRDPCSPGSSPRSRRRSSARRAAFRDRRRRRCRERARRVEGQMLAMARHSRGWA